jgi:hypothetical protein
MRLLDKVYWQQIIDGRQVWCPFHKRAFYETYCRRYPDGIHWEEGRHCLGEDYQTCNWRYVFPKYLYQETLVK